MARAAAVVIASILLLAGASAQTGPAVFDVTQFGARGDGLADDTRAFSAAVLAAVGAGGGVIYAPHTRAFYRLSGCPALRFQADVPITLRGDGRFLTVIETASSGCNTIEVAQSRFTISDLTLDCTEQCTAGALLNFLSGSYVEARDVWFGFRTQNDVAIGASGLPRASSDKVSLENIDGHIGHGGGTGIDLRTGYSDIELRNVRLNCNEPNRRAAQAYALRAHGSFDTLLMSDVYFQDCGYGLAFVPDDGAIAEDIIGTNVTLDGMEQAAVWMRPSGARGTGMVLRMSLAQLWAGAQGAPGGKHAIGIFLDGGPLRTGVDGVRISNFTVPLAQTYAIALDRGGDSVFPMHAAFSNGSISAWSRARPGTYEAIAAGVTAPVNDVRFSGVTIGAWGRVGTTAEARRAYRIYPGSRGVRIEGLTGMGAYSGGLTPGRTRRTSWLNIW